MLGSLIFFHDFEKQGARGGSAGKVPSFLTVLLAKNEAGINHVVADIDLGVYSDSPLELIQYAILRATK